MSGSNHDPNGTILPTSDNQYFDREMSPSESQLSYTPTEAGQWLGKSSRWVRQKATELKIGQKHKKLWTFSINDLMMLKLAIRRSKKEDVPMRDVSPRSAEDAAAINNTIDDLHRYLADQLRKLKGEFFDLGRDILTAAHNEHVKDFNRHEKQIFENWEDIKEVRKELRDLKALVEQVRGIVKGSGAGVLALGGTAPLSLDTGRAEALAA